MYLNGFAQVNTVGSTAANSLAIMLPVLLKRAGEKEMSVYEMDVDKSL